MRTQMFRPGRTGNAQNGFIGKVGAGKSRALFSPGFTGCITYFFLSLFLSGLFTVPAYAQYDNHKNFVTYPPNPYDTVNHEYHFLLQPYHSTDFPDADFLQVSVNEVEEIQDPPLTVPNIHRSLTFRLVNSVNGTTEHLTELDLDHTNIAIQWDSVVLTGITYNNDSRVYVITATVEQTVGTFGNLTKDVGVLIEISEDMTAIRTNRFFLQNLNGNANISGITNPLDIVYLPGAGRYAVVGYVTNDGTYEMDVPGLTASLFQPARIPFMHPYRITVPSPTISNQVGFIALVDAATLSVAACHIVKDNTGLDMFTVLNRVRYDKDITGRLLFTGTTLQEDPLTGNPCHGALLAGTCDTALGNFSFASMQVDKYFPTRTQPLITAGSNLAYATGNDIVSRLDGNGDPEFYMASTAMEQYNATNGPMTLNPVPARPNQTVSSILLHRLYIDNNGELQFDNNLAKRYFVYPSWTSDIPYNPIPPPVTTPQAPDWLSLWSPVSYTLAKATNIFNFSEVYPDKLLIAGHLHYAPFMHPAHALQREGSTHPFFINIDLSNPSLAASVDYKYRQCPKEYAWEAPASNDYLHVLNPVLNNLNFIAIPGDTVNSRDPYVLVYTAPADNLTLPPGSNLINTLSIVNLNYADLQGQDIVACNSDNYRRVAYDIDQRPSVTLVEDANDHWSDTYAQEDYRELADTAIYCYDMPLRPAALQGPDALDKLQLRPNPTNGRVYGTHTATLQYRVYSAEGKLLQQGSIGAGEAIDISAYSPGLYMVEIQQQNKRRHFKLSKY